MVVTQNPPALTLEPDFRASLAEEAKRSKRYSHPFAVIVLRPDGDALRIGENIGSYAVALLASGLVRECDTVSLLGGQRALALLLPETGVEGAGRLVERVVSVISRFGHKWNAELFVYPENQGQIMNLLRQAA